MPGGTKKIRSEITEAPSTESFGKLGLDGHGRHDGRREGACVSTDERGQIGVANASQQPRFEISCGVGSSSAPH
jgi:hypothetical protein